MKDAMALLYQCLKSDGKLMEMLGGKSEKNRRVYNNPRVPDAKEFPRVTMQEILNDDDEFSDDAPEVSRVVAKVDVWSTRNECYPIAVQIKKTVKRAFRRCVVTLEGDLYEDDTKVYHKPIKIIMKIEQEDEQ